MAKEEGEERIEKHVPEKPSSFGGELGFKQILIIIGGTVILIFVLFIVGYMVVIKPDLQQTTGDSGKDKEKTEKVDNVNKSSEEINNPKNLAEIERSFETEDAEKFSHFMMTGRITTNPKASDQFIVIDLGLDYRVKEDFPAEDLKEDSEFLKKLSSMVRGTVNNVLGSLTIDDIHNMRRDSLQLLFRDNLRPVFLRNKLLLSDVILQEFIIQ